MISVAITCAKRTTMSPPECREDSIIWDAELPLPTDEVQQRLAARGWVEEDGEYYCPRHRPADAGIMWRPPFPDGEYHPVADSGWEARTLTSSNWIELRPIHNEAVDG